MGKSVQQRRAARIAHILPIVDELIRYTDECNTFFCTRRVDAENDNAVWLITPFSINGRGDEPLAESNYRVIRADLAKVAGKGIGYRTDAWPGGTIHTITVRADDALALRAVQEWTDALAAYPVADEMDLAELEAELKPDEEDDADWQAC